MKTKQELYKSFDQAYNEVIANDGFIGDGSHYSNLRNPANAEYLLNVWTYMFGENENQATDEEFFHFGVWSSAKAYGIDINLFMNDNWNPTDFSLNLSTLTN